MKKVIDQQRSPRDGAPQPSAELFAKVFHATTAALCISRLDDGRLVDVNDSFARLFEYTRDEMIGRNAVELGLHEGTVERAERARLLREQGGIRDQEITFRTKTGALRHTLISSEITEVAGESLALNTVLDITERKRAEDALRESEALAREQANRLQVVLDTAPVIIWIAHDREGRVITGNRAAEELLRTPGVGNQSKSGPEAGRLAHFRVYKDGVELAPEQMPLQRVAASGHSLADYSELVVFDDGTARSLLGNVTPVLDVEGRPAGAIAAFLDVTERKRWEALLERQANLLEQTHDAIIIWRMGGGILYWNRACEELYGWAREEALGRVTHELFQTEHPISIAEINAALEREGKWNGEVTHVTRDGRRIILESRRALAREGDERLVIETNRDITARKQAESQREAALEALRESERLLRAFFDSPNSMRGILEADGQGLRFVTGNDALLGLLQITREQLAGKSLGDAGMPGDVQQQWIDESERSRLTGQTVNFEFYAPYRTPPHWYYVTVSHIGPGPNGRQRYTFISLDITARRQAEEDLRASRSDLNHAQAVAQTGSWRLDLRTNELRWSDETYRMFGVPTGAPLTYEVFQSCIHPEDRANVDAAWQAALRGATYDIEHRIVVGDEVRWVRERAEMEFGPAGVLLSGFGTVQDITERKHAQRELERLLAAEAAARREAERANELRLRFLAMISHELRTPLTSIKGFASTLLADDVTWDAASQRDFLETIDVESDKLAEMIDQILDLSRIEAGSLRIQLAPVALAGVIDTAAAQLQALASRHVLVIDLQDGLAPVTADRSRVAQVLTNLVGNAVKYSTPGTRIEVNARPDGAFVRVSVCDEGVGIALEDRTFVFEAFRRGSDRRFRHIKGAGLGLAICKGIVEAHGGRIWIEDHAGRGTTVSFTLPVAG
jgi:PAS domain S-box-containing protein